MHIHHYLINLYPNQSHFKNKSKCDIAVSCLYFAKKKKVLVVRLLFVISIVACLVRGRRQIIFG